MKKWEEPGKYVLEFTSFKLGSLSKWCPKVLIKDLKAKKTIPMLWDVSLDSKEEANNFASVQIDKYLSLFLGKSR